jgi:hypothetical protein
MKSHTLFYYSMLQLLPLAAGSVHKTLLSWARDSGCKIGPVHIAPSSIGGGIGMFASASLAANDMLFAVPRSLHIGFETALADPLCGNQFKEDGYALGALCAFIVKQHLCGESQFGPYVDSLNFDRSATDVLHWTAEEMELLECSGAAFTEAEKLRDDVEDLIGYALNLEPLRQCVREASGINDEDELDESIAEAIISAHASLLSRSFGVPGASSPQARELIPLLDALQHGIDGPTICHDTEMVEGLGPCTVARARQPIAAGDELWNWYGDHPDFVFATQFGFVPSAAADPEGDPKAFANCACQLNLADGFADGGSASAGARIGPSIALAAQMRVAQMREEGGTRLSGDSDEEDEENARAITKLRLRRRIEASPPDGDSAAVNDAVDGQLELARLLLQAGAWAEYPLKFVLSNELIAQVADDMEARRYPSNRHGAAALVACARLCALDPSDLLALRDDTTEEEEAGADPNAKLDEALRRLCVDGRLSEDNDRKAAELVRAAARRQLEALEGVGVQEVHDGIASKGGGTAGGCSVREECVRLVQDVRASEMHVLRALALGDGADRLLGLVRVSKAER